MTFQHKVPLSGVLVVVSWMCFAAGQGTRAAEDVPGTIWTTTLQETGSDYGLISAAESADGSLTWLLTQKRPAGTNSFGEGAAVSLVEVDEKGKVVSTTDLTHLFGASSQLVPGLPLQLAVATSKELYICANAGADSVRLLGVNFATHKADVSKVIQIGNHNAATTVVTKVLALSENALLVTGLIDSGGFIAKLTPLGEVTWVKSAGDDVGVLLDAVERRGGGIVAVGAKRNRKEAEGLFVVEYDSAGRFLRKTSIEGSFAQIAQGVNGAYAMVEDRPNGFVFDIWTLGQSTTLQPSWGRILVRGENNPYKFHIAAVAGGGYMIAGVRDFGLWLSRLQEDGGELWTNPAPLQTPYHPRVTNMFLLPSGREFVLVASMTVTTKENYRYSSDVIQLIRFRPQ